MSYYIQYQNQYNGGWNYSVFNKNSLYGFSHRYMYLSDCIKDLFTQAAKSYLSDPINEFLIQRNYRIVLENDTDVVVVASFSAEQFVASTKVYAAEMRQKTFEIET